MADLSRSHADQTRAEITRVAYRLFINQGYHGTSMRQVAEAAGIALGGIYNHFASKESLFVEVLYEYHPLTRLLPAIEDLQAACAEDFVRQAAHQFIEHLNERKEFFSLIFIEMVELKAAHIESLVADFVPRIVALAQRFEDWPGELHPIPAPVRMRAFLGLLMSYVLTDMALQNFPIPGMPDNVVDMFVDIYLHGILTRGNQHDKLSPDLTHP